MSADHLCVAAGRHTDSLAAGPGAGPPRAFPGDADLVHQRDELRAVTMLARGEDIGDRAAPPVRDQVNLGGQPAAGPAQPLPPRPGSPRVLVIRPCPPRPVPPARHGGRRPRAGARAPRWNPSSPSSPCPLPRRTQPAARPGSAPTSRPAASGDAAHTPCSQFPNPGGRSRHGHPVRVRKKIPLITVR